MIKIPSQPGPAAYITVVCVGIVMVVSLSLRYLSTIHHVKIQTAVSLTWTTVNILLIAGTFALAWRLDRRREQVKRAEEQRQATWVGYGNCARDVFDPPDTGDTMDLLRI